MRGPGLHQRAALRERRAAPVRLLDGIADRMRQRGLGDLACKLRLVTAPVPSALERDDVLPDGEIPFEQEETAVNDARGARAVDGHRMRRAPASALQGL